VVGVGLLFSLKVVTGLVINSDVFLYSPLFRLIIVAGNGSERKISEDADICVNNTVLLWALPVLYKYISKTFQMLC
jgi:hypothetical protein